MKPTLATASRLAVVLLLVWIAAAGALEVYRCVWLHYADPWSANEPGTWRFTSGQVARLEAFVGRLDEHLPPRAVVAVSSQPGPPAERLIRFLWFAYLLPEQRLRPVRDFADGLAAELWIAYGTRLEDPRLDLVSETGDGALYRVTAAAEAAP